MDYRESEIYNGLKLIGPEIAAFFFDAIKLSKLDLDTKPYILSHLSREIESGLRDVLAPNEEVDIQYCSECKQRITKRIPHKISILKALGIDKENDFSKEWHSTAKLFHKYAHRHGVWKTPREKNEFDEFWISFVNILEKLVGNYYSISDRLDSIINIKTPTKEIIGSLENLLELESRYSYFFKKLESPEWLDSLNRSKLFEGNKNPAPLESEDNPGYYSMPLWSPLIYLEKVSKQNYRNPKITITKILLDIIDNIFLFRNSNGERIANNRSDYYLINIISFLPSKYLSNKHFEYIIIAFNNKWGNNLISVDFGENFIKRFIQEEDSILLLKALDVVFSYSNNNTKITYKITSIFEYNYLSDLIKEYKSGIIKTAGKQGLKLVIKKLDELISTDENLFNSFVLPTIENHDQTSEADSYECQLIYFIRDYFLELTDEIELLLASFLRKKEAIYQRIAIYIINQKYQTYKQHFWNWAWNPLGKFNCKHEVWELLHSNSSKFNSKEINRVINWIETNDYYVSDNSKQDADLANKIIAYSKKEWLEALLPTNKKEVLDLHGKYNAINDSIVDHPGFSHWSETFWGSQSPIDSDAITELTISELINYFVKFSKETRTPLGATLDGLADQIIVTIKDNPAKYTQELKTISNAPIYFQYCWIRGLEESWSKESSTFTTKELLETIHDILQSDSFWHNNNNNIQGNNYYKWFVSETLSLIKAGVSNDEHAFEAENIELVKSIIFLIHTRDASEINDMNELSMTALNNIKGKTYQSLLELSLRISRLSNSDKGYWDKQIKEKIIADINKGDDNPLMYFVLGQFLINILYLDKKWLLDNFSLIFPMPNINNWEAAFSGYLFYNPQPNKTLFQLLKDGGHIEKAIDYDFSKERYEATSNLIRHLCISHTFPICENELDIKDNLIQKIIYTNRKDHLNTVIFHFWRPNSILRPEEIKKIKPLWHALFNRAKKMENKQLDLFILSSCTRWIKNFKVLDIEIIELLRYSARYIDSYDKSFFLDSMLRYVKANPKEVGELLIEMFSFNISYDISRGKIGNIIEQLYVLEYKQMADKICIMHGEKGIYFLRDIYDKYNPK